MEEYGDSPQYVCIKVYEGERSLARDNDLIGEFVLTGVFPVGKVKVIFDINEQGILTVSALDMRSRKSNSLTITNITGGLSCAEFERLVAKSM